MKSNHLMMISIIWMGIGIGCDNTQRSILLFIGGLFYGGLGLLVYYKQEKPKQNDS